MNEIQKTVLIDMDGVMANFDSAALVNIPKELIVARSHFYVLHDYPEQLQPSIEKVYNLPGFFENLEPMPDLFEGWQAMLDHGYLPRVASAPLKSSKTTIEEKIKWLDRIMVPEFGTSVVENAIIDNQKWKYPALAIIDDNPTIIRDPDGENSAEWKHILFGWPHLSSVPLATAAFRLLSWQESDKLIETLDIIDDSRQS